MLEHMTTKRMTEILERIKKIHLEMGSRYRGPEDPFDLLESAASIAMIIMGQVSAGRATGQVSLNSAGYMLLLLRKNGEKWNLQLSDLSNRHPIVVAVVHEYFQKEDLMSAFLPYHE